jgi:hypothetical protein
MNEAIEIAGGAVEARRAMIEAPSWARCREVRKRLFSFYFFRCNPLITPIPAKQIQGNKRK